MADIQHTLNINAPAESVYRALSTINGLASWWTSTTAGESTPGGVIDFRFNAHLVRMRVDQLERNMERSQRPHVPLQHEVGDILTELARSRRDRQRPSIPARPFHLTRGEMRP